MRLTLFKLVLLFFLLTPCTVQAASYDIPRISGEDIYNSSAEKIISGNFDMNPINIFNSIVSALLKEIKDSGYFTVTVLIIAAMSGTIKILGDSFNGEGARAAQLICFAMMSTISLRCFCMALEYGTNVVNTVCDFINKFTPAFVMTILACGNFTTAGVFSPVLSGTVYIISIIVSKCLVPMISFSAILSVAGNIVEKMQVSNFCRVLKSLSKWIMVALITVFTAVSAAYGLSAPSLDAVGAKTVKFAVGSMVPVVGGFLSDTLETVLSGTRLVKNAAGTAGMIAICAMCLIPVLKVFAIQLILKAGAALCEPLTDKRVSNMLWDMSESVTMIFAAVVMVMVIFLINIGIILAVTGF